MHRPCTSRCIDLAVIQRAVVWALDLHTQLTSSTRGHTAVVCSSTAVCRPRSPIDSQTAVQMHPPTPPNDIKRTQKRNPTAMHRPPPIQQQPTLAPTPLITRQNSLHPATPPRLQSQTTPPYNVIPNPDQHDPAKQKRPSQPKRTPQSA